MSVELGSLWLPIIVAGIGVFVVSSLIWVVIQYHNSDWQKLPDEEGVRAALGRPAPGQYTLPYAADNKARADESWQAKYREGPVAMLTVLPHGNPAMGRQLGSWLAWCIVVALFVGYVAGSMLPPGSEYLKVFQVTSTTTWLAYAGGAGSQMIWFGHTSGRTIKDIIDALVYGLLTGGVFGWLWP